MSHFRLVLPAIRWLGNPAFLIAGLSLLMMLAVADVNIPTATPANASQGSQRLVLLNSTGPAQEGKGVWESVGENICIEGPAKVKVTKKNGEVVEIDVGPGGKVTTKKGKKGRVEVKRDSGFLISAEIDQTQSSFSYLFPPELGGNAPVAPVSGTITALVDEEFNVLSAQIDESVPSVDFLGGEAETGSQTFTEDPSLLPVGTITPVTGGFEFTLTLGEIWDMPNLRVVDGSPDGAPATCTQTLSGTFTFTNGGGIAEPIVLGADAAAETSGSPSSHDYTAPIAAVAAGAVIALAAGGWYVRRRFRQRRISA